MFGELNFEEEWPCGGLAELLPLFWCQYSIFTSYAVCGIDSDFISSESVNH